MVEENNIKVSFIIPVYNKSNDQVEKCLQSLQTTSFSNEILFVNDGSSYSLTSQYKKLAYKYNAIYFEKENGGVGSARNFGIARAKGKYISFIDADDEFNIKVLNSNILSQTRDIIFFNVERKIASTNKSQIFTLKNDDQNSLLKNAFTEGLLTWSVGKLYLRDFLLKNNLLFNTSMKFSEDFDFVIRNIEKKPSINYYPQVIYIYKYDYLTTELREKKFPLQVLKDVNQSFEIDQKILNSINLSKTEKIKINKKIRQDFIKNILRIYSNYLISNPKNARKDIYSFEEVLNNIAHNTDFNFTTKTRVLMIKHHVFWSIKIYFYAKKIYHFVKRSN